MALGGGHQIRRRGHQDDAAIERSGRDCADVLCDGRSKVFPPAAWPLLAFAGGAVFSTLAFIFAFLAQLKMGNARVAGINKSDSDSYWKWGNVFSGVAILFA